MKGGVVLEGRGGTIYMYTCVYMYTYMYMYAYLYMHTYLYANVHVSSTYSVVIVQL